MYNVKQLSSYDRDGQLTHLLSLSRLSGWHMYITVLCVCEFLQLTIKRSTHINYWVHLTQPNTTLQCHITLELLRVA